MESERVNLNLDDLEKVSGGIEYELKGYGKVKCKYCGTTTEIKTAVE